MRHIVFAEFLAQLKQFTPEQRKRLVQHLAARESIPAARATTPLPAPTGCPHRSPAVERLGSWRQSPWLKRYRCKDCGRTVKWRVATQDPRRPKGRVNHAHLNGAQRSRQLGLHR